MIIEKPKTIKPGDIFFDSNAKVMFKVGKLEDGVITGVNPVNGGTIRIHAQSDDLHHLIVEDAITEERFEISYDQQAYLYKSGMGKDFKFFDRTNHMYNIQEAVILAKNLNQTIFVKEMNVIANEYGMYVAGQKAINEPAKTFEDWHFEVSI